MSTLLPPNPLPFPLPPPAAAPPLTNFDILAFNAWFNHERSLPEIARELETNVVALADWAAQPHIRARMQAVKAVAEDRNDCLHTEARHDALHRLSTLARFAENEEIACRAASRILLSRLCLTSSTPLNPAPPITLEFHPAAQPAPAPAQAPPAPAATTPRPAASVPDEPVIPRPARHYDLPRPSASRPAAAAILQRAGSPSTLTHALAGAQHGP